MCIAFPGKIISIDEKNIAVLDIGGTRRKVSLDIIAEEVSSGDYVISHAGFAIHKIDEEAARESLALLKEILDHETH
jgi:hydrogenase expression/formation protein HypC